MTAAGDAGVGVIDGRIGAVAGPSGRGAVGCCRSFARRCEARPASSQPIMTSFVAKGSELLASLPP